MFHRVIKSKKTAKVVLIDVTTTANGTSKFADYNIEIDTDDVIPIIAYFMSKIIKNEEFKSNSKFGKLNINEQNNKLQDKFLKRFNKLVTSIKNVENEFKKFDKQIDPDVINEIVKIFCKKRCSKKFNTRFS